MDKQKNKAHEKQTPNTSTYLIQNVPKFCQVVFLVHAGKLLILAVCMVEGNNIEKHIAPKHKQKNAHICLGISTFGNKQKQTRKCTTYSNVFKHNIK